MRQRQEVQMLTKRRLQVVVLGQVLAADCTVGYEDIVNTQVCAGCLHQFSQVLRCNGEKLLNFAQLCCCCAAREKEHQAHGTH